MCGCVVAQFISHIAKCERGRLAVLNTGSGDHASGHTFFGTVGKEAVCLMGSAFAEHGDVLSVETGVEELALIRLPQINIAAVKEIFSVWPAIAEGIADLVTDFEAAWADSRPDGGQHLRRL